MKRYFKKAIAFIKRQRYTLVMVITNTKRKLKTMRILQPKQQPARYNRRPKTPWYQQRDTIDVLLMLTWLSGVYATIAVAFNISTAGLLPKIMLAPLAIALAVVFVQKFTKK